MPIRVVNIDDASLSKIGQWPWPRTVIAQLIDKLRDAGSAVIAFDIDFGRAGPYLTQIAAAFAYQKRGWRRESGKAFGGGTRSRSSLCRGSVRCRAQCSAALRWPLRSEHRGSSSNTRTC